MKWIFLMIAALIFSGCTGTNHINIDTGKQEYVELGRKMTVDVAKHLSLSFPPAHTQLCLNEKKASAYEQQLIVALRAKGYGLECPGTDVVIAIDSLGSGYIATYTAGRSVFTRAYDGNGRAISSWSNGGGF